MRKHIISGVISILFFTAPPAIQSQEAAPFPYPGIPDSLEQGERLSYMLSRFWENYAFNDSSAYNRTVGEQGFVDFVQLMQAADEKTACMAAAVFADSLGNDSQRLTFFENLMDRYLSDRESPVWNDSIYSILLNALPPSPQRMFLLSQLRGNHVGMIVSDCWFQDGQGQGKYLHECITSVTLIVFYDPSCDRCNDMLPQIKSAFPASSPVQVIYIDIFSNPDVSNHFFLPTLPALYLVNGERKVVVRDGTLDEIMESADGIITQNRTN